MIKAEKFIYDHIYFIQTESDIIIDPIFCGGGEREIGKKKKRQEIFETQMGQNKLNHNKWA